MKIRQLAYWAIFASLVFVANSCATTSKSYLSGAGREGARFDAAHDTLVTEFLDKKGRTNFKTFELGGKTLFIEDYDYEKDGKYRVFRKEGHFKKAQGTAYGRYPDGKIWLKTTLKDDKPHGDWVSYHANGAIECKATFVEGNFDKQAQYFWENGQLFGILTYDKGLLKSVEGYFDKEGKPLPKGSFENGNGELFHYDHTGKKEPHVDIYENGRKVKTKKIK